MTKYFLVAIATVTLIACRKQKPLPEPPVSSHPVMVYKDLQNVEVKYGQNQYIDVDNDGSRDFLFNVQLIGDPILQRDRMQFNAKSGIKRNLLNNDFDESPILNKGDSILKKHIGYNWWEISSIVLAEKIITYNGDSWEGLWKNADHKYLPIQVDRSGKLYHGWIEISFKTAEEKLILHRAAISSEEERSIIAGI